MTGPRSAGPWLALTDDEVVALAVERESAWPSSLPTVETKDEQLLVEAAMRGMRALAVRDLIDRDGEIADDVVAVADVVLGNEPLFTVYLGDTELNRCSDLLSSAHYRHDEADAWLLESISPLGVHEFASYPSHVHVAYLGALAREAFNDGLPLRIGGAEDSAGLDDTALACIAAQVPEGLRIWGFAKDVGRRIDVTEAGVSTAVDVDVDDFLGFLDAG